MSVTFSAEFVPNTPHRIVCSCSEWKGETYPTAYEARQAAPFAWNHCTDELCLAYPVTIEEVDETPESQMSNSNAVVVLDALGIMNDMPFEDRCSGTMAASYFLERVLFAHQSVIDTGRSTEQVGNLITMERPAGYITEKLDELEAVAIYAMERDLKVCWG